MPATAEAALWRAAACLIAAPVLLPLAAIAFALPAADGTLWRHLASTTLPDVAATTAWLLLGVGLGTAVLGTSLAALVALTDFPGRRWLGATLLLPLAMPGYVLATVVVGQLDFAGPLATWLRERGVVLPPIRSLGGAVLTLTLALYPYVYLVAYNAFASQGARALEAARLLGHSPFAAFRRVALPQAAPWIAGGTLLVLMETLADFGAVSAFGLNTFTTAIYRAWMALFSIETALQLSALLILLVLALYALEARSRRHARFDARPSAAARLPLAGAARWTATAACLTVLVLAFALPALQLGVWALGVPQAGLWASALDAFRLGALAAAVTLTAATVLALARRFAGGGLVSAAQRLASLGYALPGPLLALGLFVPVAGSLAWLNARLGTEWAVGGSLLLLLAAYAVRFMAVAQTPLNTQLLRLSPQVDAQLRLLAMPRRHQLRRVHLPALAPAALTAALLVFVDVMKELPLTLLLRPFGWEPLAVRVFEHTREGQWQAAGAPALLIVLAGLLPVLLLARALRRPPAGSAP